MERELPERALGRARLASPEFQRDEDGRGHGEGEQAGHGERQPAGASVDTRGPLVRRRTDGPSAVGCPLAPGAVPRAAGGAGT